MKKIILMALMVAATFTGDSVAQTASKQAQSPQLLTWYYTIKDALVAGNAKDAAMAATSFVNTVNTMDRKVIPEESVNKLAKDAGKISKSKDIEKQREYFATFSTNMATVTKAVKLSDKPVYYAYCPMKKAYWLSNEQEIKNPYYGSSMLTCGEVLETIE